MSSGENSQPKVTEQHLTRANAPVPTTTEEHTSLSQDTTVKLREIIGRAANKAKAEDAQAFPTMQTKGVQHHKGELPDGQVPFPEPDEVEPVRPPEPTTTVAKAVEEATPEEETEPEPEPQGDSLFDTPEEAPPKEEPEEPSTDDSKADSIRNLRKKSNEYKQKAEEVAAKNQELQEKLEAYEKGEALPEKVAEMETKIHELTKYQKIVNLEASDEYQEKYVQPLQELNKELGTYAGEYNLPQSVVNQLLNAESSAQMNKVLNQNGVDPISAIELKKVAVQMQNVYKGAQEAKADPENSMERLFQEAEENKRKAYEDNVKYVTATSKDAWTDVMAEVERSKKFPELIPDPQDEDHNKKWVYPLQQKASEEYGKLVKALTETGMKNPPKEVLKALARSVQYAVAASTVVSSRNEALERLHKVDTASGRTSRPNRPRIGSSTASATPHTQRDVDTSFDLAASLKEITRNVKN